MNSLDISLHNSIARSSVLPAPAQIGCLVALVWLASLSAGRAVSPPPDGGYDNYNTAEGANALFSLTTGNNNTALGNNALLKVSGGSGNTAVGSGALSNNFASNNTALGFQALLFNTNGQGNAAVGLNALVNNESGSDNTATGMDALFSNIRGGGNTATGISALYSNDSGNYNTATGIDALYYNTQGGYNTATGFFALLSNTYDSDNTTIGNQALDSNTIGTSNAAIGENTLSSNTIGNNNTASGTAALYANTSGNNNAALGYKAGYLITGSNNIVIGAGLLGVAGEANTTRIGKSTQARTFIAGISGKTVPGTSAAVYINTNGQLGTIQSSARFKDNIKPMNNTSEAILKLKPVTFHYKQELDPEKIPQFGLIAEEVEKANPDLVVRDEEGNVTTVRYEAVNAMLLNEFLKAHCKVEEQEAAIAQLKASMAQQQAQIEALNATVQKVSTGNKIEKSVSQALASN